MKNKSVNMLIIAIILLSLLAVALIVFLLNAHDKFDDSITVSENGVTESILEVRDLTLNPTDEKEYHVNLVCEATGDYKISLDYREKHDGGMKEFVVVHIKLEDEEVYVGKLSDLLDNDVIVDLVGELHADEPFVITFCYEMPREIGNEAQGTSADFDIVLKIQKD